MERQNLQAGNLEATGTNGFFDKLKVSLSPKKTIFLNMSSILRQRLRVG